MKNLIHAFILLTFAMTLPVFAPEASIRVIALGGDSDHNSVR